VRLLLDSHILIWLMEDDARLSDEMRRIIFGAAEVFASTVSIWELAIKVSLGKLKLDVERFAGLLDAAGIKELPMTRQHAITVSRLPLLHRDPFDRMIVAQAISEPMRLLTADAWLGPYSELVICV
jgi:PIN domain nuclease of toxin-antitoxin system